MAKLEETVKKQNAIIVEQDKRIVEQNKKIESLEAKVETIADKRSAELQELNNENTKLHQENMHLKNGLEAIDQSIRDASPTTKARPTYKKLVEVQEKNQSMLKF